MALERLAGRRVLITGGAGGVGRETAARMLAAGAQVVSADIPGATRHADGAIAFAGDLARQDEIERLFHFVDDQLGGLDILVACAGLPSDPLMTISDAGWRQVIDANLVSYVGCAKKAIERIRVSGREDGQVIFVGSISVHIKAVGESVYNASKGGVALFAETLRKEMIAEKIRVTLIEPGAIATHLQPYSDEKLQEFEDNLEMLPAAEVAEGILFAATRPPGVDVVTLRIEPLVQKIC
ncbi:MAG TPA: SDR family oxidoreductase [Croceibacterium sp.]|nr:SDR family oxidoreductase [Croceibacterium sp.]